MKREKISKAAVTKEIFMKGLLNYIRLYLAQLYKEGKTTLKQIASLMDVPFIDVISQIPPLVDDIQIDPQAEQYSQEMSKLLLLLLQQAQRAGLSFQGPLSKKSKILKLKNEYPHPPHQIQ